MGVTSSGPAIVATVDGVPLLGQKVSAQSIPVVLASDQPGIIATADATATAAAPSYVEGTASPLSQTLAGDLRVIAKQSTSPWVVSGTVTANQGGAWNITNISGTVSLPTGAATAANQITWQSATGAAVPVNAVYQGFDAATALPSAATAGNIVGAMSDKFGRQVVLAQAPRDLVGTQATTISASTAETTIVSAGATGVFNDIVMFIVSNTSTSTNTRIDFRDATNGSVLFSLASIGGGAPVGFALPVPVPQTTAANNWTAQCATSTTDIRIYAVFVKNK